MCGKFLKVSIQVSESWASSLELFEWRAWQWKYLPSMSQGKFNLYFATEHCWSWQIPSVAHTLCYRKLGVLFFPWMLFLDSQGKSQPDRASENPFMGTSTLVINRQLMSMWHVYSPAKSNWESIRSFRKCTIQKCNLVLFFLAMQ